jgi:hypothetical protein
VKPSALPNQRIAELAVGPHRFGIFLIATDADASARRLAPGLGMLQAALSMAGAADERLSQLQPGGVPMARGEQGLVPRWTVAVAMALLAEVPAFGAGYGLLLRAVGMKMYVALVCCLPPSRGPSLTAHRSRLPPLCVLAAIATQRRSSRSRTPHTAFARCSAGCPCQQAAAAPSTWHWSCWPTLAVLLYGRA